MKSILQPCLLFRNRTIFRLFLSALLLLVFTPALFAQTLVSGQLRPVVIVSRIMPLSARDLQVIEIKTANLVMDLKTDKAHHLREKDETYTYRDGSKQENALYFDSEHNRTHFTENIYSPGHELIEAISETYSGNKLSSGWSWGVSNKKMEVEKLDINTLQYAPFTGNFIKPGAYVPDLSSVGAIKKIQDFPFLNLPFEETKSSNEYFQGGSVTTNAYEEDGYRIMKETYKNASGKILHQNTGKYLGDGYWMDEYVDYDCNGSIIYHSAYIYDDDDDYDVETIKMYYKDGKPVSGYHDIDDYDHVHRNNYNPETGEFDPVDSHRMLDFLQQEPDLKPEDCDSVFDRNRFYLGPMLVVEDAVEKFETFGGMFEFTHFCPYHPRIGYTGDAGFSVGSNNGSDYSKYSLMAGITAYPLVKFDASDQTSISVHALAGATYLHSKFQYMNFSSSNAKTYLSLDVGVGADFRLNDKIGIGIRGGFNPVFSKGNTSGNWRFGAGLDF